MNLSGLLGGWIFCLELVALSLILTRFLYSYSIKFYFVDVNSVPSTLVSRAGVTVGFLKSPAFFVFPLRAGSSY